MIILSAIGRFFVRIGRWIKDTAWVQPLLIVGGIFAIIFSIPYIGNWVGSWFKDGNAADNYFSRFSVSLDGCQDEGADSDANRLFNYMANELKDPSLSKRYGEKFFVVFVEEGCAGCDSIYKGFEVLEDEWGKGSFATPKDKEAEEFKLYTIFVDTKKTVDNESKYIFKEYFYDQYIYYFEEMKAVLQDCDYANNSGRDSYLSDLDALDDVNKFKAPTIFLYDPRGVNSNQLGVSEVIFNLSGKNDESGTYPLAYTLFDCWYHQDIFGPNYSKD